MKSSFVIRHAQALVTAMLVLATVTSYADRPRIGLVLGGGGARGAAHIGVLKELERQRIPIRIWQDTRGA